jgi:hypothetical protein
MATRQLTISDKIFAPVEILPLWRGKFVSEDGELIFTKGMRLVPVVERAFRKYNIRSKGEDWKYQLSLTGYAKSSRTNVTLRHFGEFKHPDNQNIAATSGAYTGMDLKPNIIVPEAVNKMQSALMPLSIRRQSRNGTPEFDLTDIQTSQWTITITGIDLLLRRKVGRKKVPKGSPKGTKGKARELKPISWKPRTSKTVSAKDKKRYLVANKKNKLSKTELATKYAAPSRTTTAWKKLQAKNKAARKKAKAKAKAKATK